MSSTNLEKAALALYGGDGLRATNLKLFPGTNRDVTAEQIAEQISAVVRAMKEGDEEVEIVNIG